jgi:hypothetical protein
MLSGQLEVPKLQEMSVSALWVVDHLPHMGEVRNISKHCTQTTGSGKTTFKTKALMGENSNGY